MATIAIIGTGLIGTSLALAFKQSHLRDLELVGTDYEAGARSAAQKTGAFSRIEGRLNSTVRDADVVILATPVMAMRALMETIGPELKEGCVVTDVGSSKRVVLGWAEEFLPRTVEFVGGHPMAGKETAGAKFADGNLFRGKAYCIIPSPRARQQAVAAITNLAEAVGARPLFIGVEEHDSFVAAASHLPFLVSVALVGCTSKSVNWEDIAQLASSGYHDVTRLASGDPIMHRDICLSNPKPIVAWIDAFIRELYEVRSMLDGRDSQLDGQQGEAIQRMFEQASEARARWLAGGVPQRTREGHPDSEMPTFAENMGQLFVGKKVMDAQKRFFKDRLDGGRRQK
jgi:prephenate dehydrogenase